MVFIFNCCPLATDHPHTVKTLIMSLFVQMMKFKSYLSSYHPMQKASNWKSGLDMERWLTPWKTATQSQLFVNYMPPSLLVFGHLHHLGRVESCSFSHIVFPSSSWPSSVSSTIYSTLHNSFCQAIRSSHVTISFKLALLNDCKQVVMLANSLTNYVRDFLIWHMVSVQDVESLPVIMHVHGPNSAFQIYIQGPCLTCI